MKRFLQYCIATIIVFCAITVSAQSKPPLRLLQTIPLPDLKAGDFDHFAVDLPGHRLFLTGEAAHAVLVMDLRANKLIHTISDVDEPHSMLYLPVAKQLLVIGFLNEVVGRLQHPAITALVRELIEDKFGRR